MLFSRGATLEGQDQADSLLIWEFQRIFSGFGRGVASSSECLRLLGHWWREVQADGHCCRDEIHALWLVTRFDSFQTFMQHFTPKAHQNGILHAASRKLFRSCVLRTRSMRHAPSKLARSQQRTMRFNHWTLAPVVLRDIWIGDGSGCLLELARQTLLKFTSTCIYLFYKIFQFVQGMISWWSSMRHDSCSSE